jgi:hypothetical protein
MCTVSVEICICRNLMFVLLGLVLTVVLHFAMPVNVDFISF